MLTKHNAYERNEPIGSKDTGADDCDPDGMGSSDAFESIDSVCGAKFSGADDCDIDRMGSSDACESIDSVCGAESSGADDCDADKMSCESIDSVRCITFSSVDGSVGGGSVDSSIDSSGVFVSSVRLSVDRTKLALLKTPNFHTHRPDLESEGRSTGTSIPSLGSSSS